MDTYTSELVELVFFTICMDMDMGTSLGMRTDGLPHPANGIGMGMEVGWLA